MVLVVATLGLRNGLIVGIAIPFSFLVTFGVLHYLLDYEFNFLVMFGMLLGLGMLIDGGIVIVEHADKLIDSGQDRKRGIRKLQNECLPGCCFSFNNCSSIHSL